jgi:hypothetical protein
MISINWYPSDRELRHFSGIWFPAFWAVVAAVYGSRTGQWQGMLPIAAVVALVSGGGLVWPWLMRPIYVAWMCAAFPIGWLVSHTLLAAVFFLVITPLGMLLRASGRDKLKLRTDPATKSYWTRRNATPPASRYFRQF